MQKGNVEDRRHVVFVLNPLSGDGAALRAWPAILAECQRCGHEFELLDERGDLGEVLVRRLLKGGVERVAGIGGDGTHCALINGLLRYVERSPGAVAPAYALIPLGTGNDIAKSIGLEPGAGGIAEAVKVAFMGEAAPMDVGWCGGRYFADAFSVGLDSLVLRARDKAKRGMAAVPLVGKFLKGYPLYLLSVMRTLLTFRRLHGEIDVDGARWFTGDFFNLLINNTKIYGGEFDPTPTARIDDGLLDLVVVKNWHGYFKKYLSDYRHNPEWVRTFGGRLTADDVETIKGTHITIRLSRRIRAQMDGEVCAEKHGRYEVNCLKGAVRVVSPE